MKMRRMGLDMLKPGECAVLRSVSLPDAARARLEEFGLLPDTQICCLYCAPHASPTAYMVDGAVFALRKKDAAGITVEMTL